MEKINQNRNKIAQKFDQGRNDRGIQILSKGNHITKLGKNHYRVESQTSDKSYHIRKLQDADIWECTCADFMYNLRKGNNDKQCKHILACIMFHDSGLDNPTEPGKYSLFV